MTPLKFINVFIFQWFFIRLAQHYEVDKDTNIEKTTAYSLMYWILPLTGWWSKNTVINNKIKHLYLWKKTI